MQLIDVHSTLLLKGELVLYLRTLAQEFTNYFSLDIQKQNPRNYAFV